MESCGPGWNTGASCLCTQVFAQTYTDECAASASDSICVYQNFSKRIEDFGSFSGWANCPDQSVLSMSGTEAQAGLPGCRSAGGAGGNCSANGSFAVPGSAGAYWLGLYHTDSVSGAKRCFYDSGKDEVFINTSRRRQKSAGYNGWVCFPAGFPSLGNGGFLWAEHIFFSGWRELRGAFTTAFRCA